MPIFTTTAIKYLLVTVDGSCAIQTSVEVQIKHFRNLDIFYLFFGVFAALVAHFFENRFEPGSATLKTKASVNGS